MVTLFCRRMSIITIIINVDSKNIEYSKCIHYNNISYYTIIMGTINIKYVVQNNIIT